MNSSVKILSLSPNHVWKLSSFFNCEKRSLLSVELKKEKLSSLQFWCGFLAKCCSIRVFEKLWAVFNAGKKLFKPAQVALTKIPRNKAKIYQKTNFLRSEGQLLTSSGCCLTLAFSLDVVQVRFASWSAYRVLLGNDLSNLLAVSVSQKYNACTFFLLK